jgi:uncharacterized membrane protein
MNADKILELFLKNKGAMIGSLIGFIFGILVIFLGVLKSLFLALCVGLGYYIGNQISSDKNYITNLLDRILPPGTYR